MDRLSRRAARSAWALGVAVAVAHCTGGGDGAPATAAADCCEIVPNASLPAGAGAIVVRYPGGPSSTRIDVYAAGDAGRAIASDYGDASLGLPPGTYDVTIGGRRVAGVDVRAGHDTRIRTGVLHVHASEGTRIDLVDPDGHAVAGDYGEDRYGLPAGSVLVEVAGERQPALIEDGKVTDF